MDKPRRTAPKKLQQVGSIPTRRPSIGYLIVALLLIGGGLIYFVMSPSAPLDTREREVAYTFPFPATVPKPIKTAMSPDASPKKEDGADSTRDLASYIPRGANPTAREAIDRLHEAGIHTGLGAFNPPGTRPNLVGLAVPENFVLPKGYVRHYQATDDGQRVEAILMYAPDQRLLDAANQPINIPQNRVVPMELAPAGLPNRQIVIPAPIESGRARP